LKSVVQTWFTAVIGANREAGACGERLRRRRGVTSPCCVSHVQTVDRLGHAARGSRRAAIASSFVAPHSG